MDLAEFLGAVSDAAQRERTNYHLTLGELISALQDIDSSRPIEVSGSAFVPGEAISYRGYYSDLSFRMAKGPLTVGELLNECVSVKGQTLEGYKGGDYLMGEDTPLWFSDYGEASSIAFIGVEDRDYAVVLTTKLIDE